MKNHTTPILLVLLLLGLAGRGMAHAGGGVSVGVQGGVAFPDQGAYMNFSFFHDDLAPYGTWFQDPTYGPCWYPRRVHAGWRPYVDGYWSPTTDGWSWVSSEPWGWATYHYGRWSYDPYRGWFWIPGSVWAPAWVAWRSGDDWLGWAPLPPDAQWDVSVGLRFRDVDRIPSQNWCFVPRGRFLDRGVRTIAVPVRQNAVLLPRTHDATRFENRGGHPVNHGVDPGPSGPQRGYSREREERHDRHGPEHGRGHGHWK